MNTVEYLTKGLNLSKIQLEAITELADICGMKSLFEANVLDDEDEEMVTEEDSANSFKPMNDLQRDALRIRNNDNNANSKKDDERLKRAQAREEELMKERAKESAAEDAAIDVDELMQGHVDAIYGGGAQVLGRDHSTVLNTIDYNTDPSRKNKQRKLVGFTDFGWGVDDGNDGLNNELSVLTNDDLEDLYSEQNDEDVDDIELAKETDQLCDIITKLCDTLNELYPNKKPPYSCNDLIKRVCTTLKTYTGNDDKISNIAAEKFSAKDADVANGTSVEDDDEPNGADAITTSTDGEKAAVKLRGMVKRLNSSGNFDAINNMMNAVDDFGQKYPNNPYLPILKDINPVADIVDKVNVSDADKLNEQWARIGETIAPGMATGNVMSSADLRKRQFNGAKQRALGKTRTTPDGKRVLSTTFKGKM